MASVCDTRQALAAMCSVLTALTSATGVSTATFAASMASQQSADTSLTLAEKQIITAFTTALSNTSPSSCIHGLQTPIDTRTCFAAMVSILTAFSSAVGTSTANFNTALGAQRTADTALTSVESGLSTLLSSAIAASTPSANAHLQV